MTVKRLPSEEWQSSDSEASETAEQLSRVSVAAEDDIIPIAYGDVEVPGKLGIVTTDAEFNLVVLVIWCVGEIEGVTQIYLNDDVPSAQVEQNHYTGTLTQLPDPIIQEVIQNYSDPLIYSAPSGEKLGIAYSVLRIPPGVTSGFPRFKARLKGRRVEVVRDSLSVGAQYTTNPATILADLITDPIIGLGRKIDEPSYTVLKDDCDEVIETNVKRREFSLLLTRQQDTERWVETLRGYCSCVLGMESGRVKFAPMWKERAGETQFDIDETNVVKGSVSIGYRQAGRPATVVTVSYTDHSTYPFTTNEVQHIPSEVTSGSQAWREQRVSLPGIPSRGQALREAEERFNALWAAPLVATWDMFDEGIGLSVGDRVNITHPLGLVNRAFRVTEIDVTAPGRWRFTAEEFNTAVRSNATVDEAPVDVILPPGAQMGSITTNPPENLTLEEIYSETNLQPPQSQILARWNPVVSALLAGYDVQHSLSGTNSWSELKRTPLNEWISGFLQTPEDYSIRVRAVATDGTVGPWAIAGIRLQGLQYNLDTPTSVRTSGGNNPFSPEALPFAIRVDWTFPPGVSNIRSTQVFWNTQPTPPDEQQLIGEYAYPTRTMTVTGLPTGTSYYFFVRFIDVNGNVGDWYASNGTVGWSSANADVILGYIDGEIQKTNLHQTLVAEIDDKLTEDSAPIIEVKESVGHLEGQYTVKIQSGGYVAGYGLAVDPTNQTKSQFLVQADRFAVGHPSHGYKYPFIIQDGVTYISKTAIGDAWIKNANIENLAVKNAKIGFNAVTQTHYLSYGSYSMDALGNWFNVTSNVGIDLSDTYGFVVIAQCQIRIRGQAIARWERNMALKINGGSQSRSVADQRIETNATDAWTDTVADLTLMHGKTYTTGSLGIWNFQIQARAYAALQFGTISAAVAQSNRTVITVFLMKR